MKKIGSFKINDSFYLTNRGIVLMGDIIEGRVKVGSTIIFAISGKEVIRKVTGVEMGDKISTREYFVGLTFMTKADIESNEFRNVKIEEQLINVFE